MAFAKMNSDTLQQVSSTPLSEFGAEPGVR